MEIRWLSPFKRFEPGFTSSLQNIKTPQKLKEMNFQICCGWKIFRQNIFRVISHELKTEIVRSQTTKVDRPDSDWKDGQFEPKGRRLLCSQFLDRPHMTVYFHPFESLR